MSSRFILINVKGTNISIKVLMNALCSEGERTGVFTDDRIEWVKITNTRGGENIVWYDYTNTSGGVHASFFEGAKLSAEEYAWYFEDTDICILRDILYQEWHLVYNIVIQMAQERLPHPRFLAFTHSHPFDWFSNVEHPFSASFTDMPRTRFEYPAHSGVIANQA